MINTRQCTICGKDFDATREWSLYCSDNCRAKGKRINAIKWKREADPLKIKTKEELETIEPYKTNFNKIMSAYRLLNRGKVTRKYLLKETKLSVDTIYRYIKTLRKLGILKENSYQLSKKYEFEPLKLWYKDLILDCPAWNTFHYRNASLFFPNIPNTKFTRMEKNELKNLLYNHIKTHNQINLLFRKIGLRLAGKIWEKRIESINVAPYTKFYIWLRLIMIHYLVTLSNAEKNECYERGIIPSVDMTDVLILKYHSFKPPFSTIQSQDNIYPEWKIKFEKLLTQAFRQYAQKKFHSFDKKLLNQEMKKQDKEIKMILEETLKIRAEAEYFITVVHPEPVSTFQLSEIGDVQRDKARKIRSAYWKPYLEDDKILLDIKESKIKLSFFDKNTDFFDGLDKEISDLYEKDEHMYNQLRRLANAFEVPTI